jgi:phosphopantothenoylcysteine decarboxylase/phosphopantothenate--cysteine ligase
MTLSEGAKKGGSRHVLLAVTGSIAAFKAAQLASLLVQAGHEVRAILTEGGSKFVGPLTFEAITSHPIGSDMWHAESGSSSMGHLDLATWADLLVVAPASAGAVARLALGLPSDLLGAVALATRAPILLAPAMESNMWRHTATRSHVDTLVSRGCRLVGPESGHLASGSSGEGRMAEPETILDEVDRIFRAGESLSGIRVLVTAGPTYETIDPVRFIGNRSSGKMGYAVAEEARDRGAQVVLVSGPTALQNPDGITTVHVESSFEMREAVLERVRDADVVVMAAAISDFAPTNPAAQKIRRGDNFALPLSPTDDIAAAASKAAPGALHVGFALETGDPVAGGKEKLQRKNLQLVVANGISVSQNPVGADTNQVTLITAEETVALPLASKREVARAIWDKAEELLHLQP